MDFPDDQVPWEEPVESPAATEMLAELDVELAPEWDRAITGSLDALFTKGPR